MFQHVPHTHIDIAWNRDGASILSKACERSGGEITGDQLKMMLARNEYTLLCLPHEVGKAWVVVTVQQMPNLRALHIQAIHAPGATSTEAFRQLQAYARHNGCTVIRGACGPAVSKLWARKFNARPVYSVMEIQA